MEGFPRDPKAQEDSGKDLSGVICATEGFQHRVFIGMSTEFAPEAAEGRNGIGSSPNTLRKHFAPCAFQTSGFSWAYVDTEKL